MYNILKVNFINLKEQLSELELRHRTNYTKILIVLKIRNNSIGWPERVREKNRRDKLNMKCLGFKPMSHIMKMGKKLIQRRIRVEREKNTEPVRVYAWPRNN